MIRLTKVLNLKEDVLQKTLLGDSSSIHPYAPKSAAGLDEGGNPKANLRHKRVLVGKEKDGTLLISRFIYEKDGAKTCIDLYDFKARELKTIYTHSSQINVVGSTITEDKGLLAFTVRADGPSADADPVFLYSSFVVELGIPSPLLNPLELNASRAHGLHFLNGAAEKSSVSLLVCSQDECTIHHISTKPNSVGGLTSIIKIKKNIISKRTVWYEYDTGRLHLYLLCKTSKASIDNEHFFKFFNFNVTKSSPIYEVPLTISLPYSKFDLLYPFPYTLGGVQRVAPHLHVVRLAGNAVCLCQQHELDSLCIKISIYIIHMRQKLDFWVPLNNIEGGWSIVSRTRALFDCIEDMLLVYIPGYFLQLIDCGEEHYPCMSMTINDREFSSPLPEESHPTLISGAQASTVVPFSLRCEDGRLMMLDTLSGIIYEYTFDRGALLHVFDVDNARLHMQTLHLACIHMQDSELVDQIILHMCTQNPQAFTVELMKEFLLGTPYQEMKASAMDPSLLQLLPITSSELLEQSLLKKLSLYNAILQTFGGYNNIPGTKIMISNREDEWKRRKYPQDKNGIRGVERPLSREGSVTQFLRSMFSIGPTDEVVVRRINPNGTGGFGESDPEDVVEECCALAFSGFVEALVDYWISQLPNNSRARLSQWASNYRDAQIVQVNRLYGHIYKSTLQSSGGHNSGTLFLLLERLYTAIEELAFPFPRGFHSTFASLGFKCLPRGAFLQCVERGIITLTPTFLRELLAMPTEDWDFRLQLLLRLRDSNKALDLIHQVDYAPLRLLLENAISSLAQCMVTSPDGEGEIPTSMFVDMEIYSNSTCIPLSALLGFINSKAPTSSATLSQPPILPPNTSPFPSFSVAPAQSADALLAFVNTNFTKLFQSFSDLK